MADNLTVSIGVDIGNTRAQLELLKAQLRDATKQMRQLSDEAAKTGETAGLTAIARNVETLTRDVAVSTRAFKEQERAIHGVALASREAGEAHKSHTGEIIKLSREIGNLDVNTTGLAKAFREIPGAAIGIATVGASLALVSKAVDSAAKSVESLSDLSEATGRSKADIVAMEKVFRDVNVDARFVGPMVSKMAEDFAKAHQNAAGMAAAVSGVSVISGGQGPGGPTQVFKGGQPQTGGFQGGIPVYRGGQPFQFDPTKGLQGLVSQQTFANTPAGLQQWFAEAVKQLQVLAKNNHDLAIQVARAQVPGMEPAQALRSLLAQTPQAMAAARTATVSDPRLRADAQQRADAFQIAQKRYDDASARAATTGGLGGMPSATGALDAATKGLEGLSPIIQKLTDMGEQLGKSWADAFQGISTEANKTKSDLETFPDLTAGAKTFENAWTSAIQDIANAWSAVKGSMNAPGPSGQAPIAPPMATGGMVPGSGLGDTVPAMLTPGEYVNKLSSVQYYGADFFRALNDRAIPRIGYAMGGLVDGLHATHFAEGGLVGSSSGTAVHVHLDGNVFPMRADDAVAQSLLATARRQQMRSAGVKPSWYGGRPGSS